VPAGTAVASPLTFVLPLPASVIRSIDVIVPPGPHGLVGFAIYYGSDQMAPARQGSWVIVDNDRVSFVPPRSCTSGAWSLVAYNQGIYDHTLYVSLNNDASVSDLYDIDSLVPLTIM
jgi:hypothetical protein